MTTARQIFIVIRHESDGPVVFNDAFANYSLAEQAITDDLPEWPGFKKSDYDIQPLYLREG